MANVTIDPLRCKGCELCVGVCPKKVLEMDKKALNAKGYHPASAARPEDCIGCAACYLMCPDFAVTVER